VVVEDGGVIVLVEDELEGGVVDQFFDLVYQLL
jgi:hypothetical protein